MSFVDRKRQEEANFKDFCSNYLASIRAEFPQLKNFCDAEVLSISRDTILNDPRYAPEEVEPVKFSDTVLSAKKILQKLKNAYASVEPVEKVPETEKQRLPEVPSSSNLLHPKFVAFIKKLDETPPEALLQKANENSAAAFAELEELHNMFFPHEPFQPAKAPKVQKDESAEELAQHIKELKIKIKEQQQIVKLLIESKSDEKEKNCKIQMPWENVPKVDTYPYFLNMLRGGQDGSGGRGGRGGSSSGGPRNAEPDAANVARGKQSRGRPRGRSLSTRHADRVVAQRKRMNNLIAEISDEEDDEEDEDAADVAPVGGDDEEDPRHLQQVNALYPLIAGTPSDYNYDMALIYYSFGTLFESGGRYSEQERAWSVMYDAMVRKGYNLRTMKYFKDRWKRFLRKVTNDYALSLVPNAPAATWTTAQNYVIARLNPVVVHGIPIRDFGFPSSQNAELAGDSLPPPRPASAPSFSEDSMPHPSTAGEIATTRHRSTTVSRPFRSQPPPSKRVRRPPDVYTPYTYQRRLPRFTIQKQSTTNAVEEADIEETVMSNVQQVPDGSEVVEDSLMPEEEQEHGGDEEQIFEEQPDDVVEEEQAFDQEFDDEESVVGSQQPDDVVEEEQAFDKEFDDDEESTFGPQLDDEESTFGPQLDDSGSVTLGTQDSFDTRSIFSLDYSPHMRSFLQDDDDAENEPDEEQPKRRKRMRQNEPFVSSTPLSSRIGPSTFHGINRIDTPDFSNVSIARGWSDVEARFHRQNLSFEQRRHVTSPVEFSQQHQNEQQQQQLQLQLQQQQLQQQLHQQQQQLQQQQLQLQQQQQQSPQQQQQSQQQQQHQQQPRRVPFVQQPPAIARPSSSTSHLSQNSVRLSSGPQRYNHPTKHDIYRKHGQIQEKMQEGAEEFSKACRSFQMKTEESRTTQNAINEALLRKALAEAAYAEYQLAQAQAARPPAPNIARPSSSSSRIPPFFHRPPAPNVARPSSSSSRIPPPFLRPPAPNVARPSSSSSRIPPPFLRPPLPFHQPSSHVAQTSNQAASSGSSSTSNRNSVFKVPALPHRLPSPNERPDTQQGS